MDITKPLHHVANYIRAPYHPVTVLLVGCGATGSQTLNKLACIHGALISYGHPGLHVTVYDGDFFEGHNVYRQACFESDLGTNKAVTCVERINRAYGLRWDAVPEMFSMEAGINLSNRETTFNIVISCVDNVQTRKDLSLALAEIKQMNDNNQFIRENRQTYYWIDAGNSKYTGQVIIGTVSDIKQPKGSKNQLVGRLKDVLMVHPDMHLYETHELQGVACSLAESLEHQDLCINALVSVMVKKMVWQLFKNERIDNHGCYFNIENIGASPLHIDPTPNKGQKWLGTWKKRKSFADRRTEELHYS